MKQTVYLLLFLIVQSIAAQQPIILLSADMPTQGWTGGRVARDTIVSNIQWGNAGVNQSYTFTNLQSMVLDTNYYVALTSGQANTFPNADLAVTADNINYLFTNTTANDFRWEGLSGTLNGCSSDIIFNPVTQLYQFPSMYGGNFNTSSSFQVIAAGSCVNQPVYQIRVTSTATAWDTIDGWGKVTTPVGSYKCLRQKRKDITTTVIDVKLFSFSPWSNFSTTVDTNVRYYYNTKEAKGSVITFGFDSLDNPVSATWSLNPPAPPAADFSSDTVAGGQVNFTDLTDGYPDTYAWNFGDGSSSSQQNPVHGYTLNGTYVL